MKKFFLTFVIISLFVVGMVFAVGDGGSGSEDVASTGIHEPGTGIENPEIKEAGQGTQANVTTETQNKGESSQIKTQTETNNPGTGEQAKVQLQSKVQSGSYTTEGGKKIELQEQANNKVQLKSGNAVAQTSMQMTQEQTQEGVKLQVQLSNGKNAEVKVMPDSASEKAIERLQLKSCTAEEGCSIELKEVGQGEQTKAAYEIKTQKESRFLGIFKAQMRVQAQVDAENGEIIKANKPWWAFLAAE